MKSRVLSSLALLTCLTLMAGFLPAAAVHTGAQGPDPDCPVDPASGDDGWYVADGPARLAGTSTAASPRAAADSDEFGYTVDDTVPFDWIDTSPGTATGLSGVAGDPGVSDAIPLGFDFKFYAGTYDAVYVSTSGAVGFDRASLIGESSTPYVPSREAPNNFIAPYLSPLWVNTEWYDGQVTTLRGGTAPNRYFVVEWHEAADNMGHFFTFQVVLREGGDILVQFLDMDRGHYYSSITAIEGEDGFDGLFYMEPGFNDMREMNGVAVLFERPDPAARVSMGRDYRGTFTAPGRTETFEVPVRNTGDLGPDVYDVELASRWPTTLTLAGDGSLLTDTDGDGALDTGEIAEGERITLNVQLASPVVASPGDESGAPLALRSSLDSSVWDGVVLQSAVPAPFAQVYEDGADGAMRLDLVRPDGQTRVKATPDDPGTVYGSGQMAVAETDDGFVTLWQKRGTVDDLRVSEIEYALYDREGRLRAGPRQLEKHDDVELSVVDSDPAVAVAPDGRIGVVWQRRLVKPGSGAANYNATYAVLDPSGHVVVPATNLTNSTAWESG
jgi:hypothetical protein